jgi:four helix bundle protein
MELARAVYKLTVKFPPSEQFGMTNQLRRAAVSVASNISEGYGRSTRGEYVLFLGHARGSNSEVMTQLMLARDLQMGNDEALRHAIALSNEVGRMLVVMMRKLRK